MASHQVGPEVLSGRVGAVPLTDHADHGVAATPELAGQPRQPTFGYSVESADGCRYRTPPQLGTKGNSGIIKGGCAERENERSDARDERWLMTE